MLGRLYDGGSEVQELKDIYPQYQIGRGTYGNPTIYTWKEGDQATLEIGSFCSFAEDVKIFLGGEHRPEWVTTFPLNLWKETAPKAGLPTTKGDVIIGSDVWVGHGAHITSGVVIGHGAVIGARSVVTKGVNPYTIVGGNPAQVIRMRFNEMRTINRLLEVQWWNWEESKIREHIPLLLSNRVEAFLNVAEKT